MSVESVHQMHPALKNEDILQEIFKHLRTRLPEDHHHYRIEGASWPYHAALVCRQFAPHGLDALWYSMTYLGPLFQLIPNIVKPPMSMARGPYDETLDSFFTKEGLSTFERYAHRIRAFRQTSSGRVSIHILVDILDCLDRRCLLPRLRYLVLHVKDDEGENSLTTFLLCPSLIRVCIVENHRQHAIGQLLPRLSRIAPRLLHFTMPDPYRSHWYSTTRISQHAWLFLFGLTGLRTLHAAIEVVISPKSFEDTWRCAGTLADLSVISLVIEELPNGPSPVRFPALTSLALQLLDLAALSNILTSGLFPTLRVLALWSPEGSTTSLKSHLIFPALAEWQRFFASLFGATILQKLKIETSTLPYETHSIKTYGQVWEIQDLFTDVMVSPQLQELYLDIFALKPLDNTAVLLLGHKFPSLTYLRLPRKISTFTFLELANIAKAFRQLSVLDIYSIDESDLEDGPALRPHVNDHPLRSIHVWKCEVSDVSVFAGAIHHLFPRASIRCTSAHPEWSDEEPINQSLSLLRERFGHRDLQTLESQQLEY